MLNKLDLLRDQHVVEIKQVQQELSDCQSRCRDLKFELESQRETLEYWQLAYDRCSQELTRNNAEYKKVMESFTQLQIKQGQTELAQTRII